MPPDTDDLLFADDDDEILFSDDEELHFDDDDEDGAVEAGGQTSWKVMLVDDEHEIHNITSLSLEDFVLN